MTDLDKEFNLDEFSDEAFDKLSDSIVDDNTPVTKQDSKTENDTPEVEDTSADTKHEPEDTESDTGEEEELTPEELKAQLKLSEQRFNSMKGRFEAEMQRRREEELERQREIITAITHKKQQDEPVREQLPPKLKELYEEFPDIAEAVDQLVSARTQNINQSVEEQIKRYINPVVTDLYAAKTDTHLGKILSKHPDAVKLKESGKLDVWIETLPVHAKRGASYILSGGTADEVIELLDQYKEYNTTKNTTKNTDKPTTTKQTASSLVDDVKTGLAVKSTKSEPNTSSKKSDMDIDAMWADAVNLVSKRFTV